MAMNNDDESAEMWSDEDLEDAEKFILGMAAIGIITALLTNPEQAIDLIRGYSK